MRKIIAILIMIGLLAGLVFYFISASQKINKKDDLSDIGISETTILPKLENHYADFILDVRKLQKNPDQIASLNCLVTKMLYAQGLSDEEVKLLLKFQRTYFTADTIEKNPEEANYEKLLVERRAFMDAKLSIIGYKVVGPQFVEVNSDEKKMLIFNVIYYLNDTSEEGEVFKGYVFQQNDNKLWELRGFGAVESFPTIY